MGDDVPTKPEGDISIASGEKGTTRTNIHYSHKLSHDHVHDMYYGPVTFNLDPPKIGSHYRPAT